MWGHVNPMIPIVQELLRHKYQLEWIIDSEFCSRLKTYNIPTIKTYEKLKYSPIEINQFNFLITTPRLIQQVKEVVNWSFSQYEILKNHVRKKQYDAVLTDCVFIGSLLMASEQKIPCFTLGVIPFPGSSKETGPYGSGWSPSQKKVRVLLNQFANYVVYYFIVRPIYDFVKKGCKEFGLDFKFRKEHFFDTVIRNSDLYLQCSLSDFE